MILGGGVMGGCGTATNGWLRSTAIAAAATISGTGAALAQAPPSSQPSVTLPTVEVISTTPLPARRAPPRAPAPTQTSAAPQQAPAPAVRPDPAAFQRDLNYRGFTASPVQGTPQGLAVYQNGVRINESYGDVVNWDFIPQMAIEKLVLVPNSPIFGLNAIGGALSFEMKNGFTYQGAEAEGLVGSYGRRQGSVQAGMQKDNVAV